MGVRKGLGRRSKNVQLPFLYAKESTARGTFSRNNVLEARRAQAKQVRLSKEVMSVVIDHFAGKYNLSTRQVIALRTMSRDSEGKNRFETRQIGNSTLTQRILAKKLAPHVDLSMASRILNTFGIVAELKEFLEARGIRPSMEFLARKGDELTEKILKGEAKSPILEERNVQQIEKQWTTERKSLERERIQGNSSKRNQRREWNGYLRRLVLTPKELSRVMRLESGSDTAKNLAMRFHKKKISSLAKSRGIQASLVDRINQLRVPPKAKDNITYFAVHMLNRGESAERILQYIGSFPSKKKPQMTVQFNGIGKKFSGPRRDKIEKATESKPLEKIEPKNQTIQKMVLPEKLSELVSMAGSAKVVPRELILAIQKKLGSERLTKENKKLLSSAFYHVILGVFGRGSIKAEFHPKGLQRIVATNHLVEPYLDALNQLYREGILESHSKGGGKTIKLTKKGAKIYFNYTPTLS